MSTVFGLADHPDRFSEHDQISILMELELKHIRWLIRASDNIDNPRVLDKLKSELCQFYSERTNLHKLNCIIEDFKEGTQLGDLIRSPKCFQKLAQSRHFQIPKDLNQFLEFAKMNYYEILEYSAEHGIEELLRPLVEFEFRMNSHCGPDMNRVLQIASESGQLEVIKIIIDEFRYIEYGSELDILRGFLDGATKSNHLEIVKYWCDVIGKSQPTFLMRGGYRFESRRHVSAFNTPDMAPVIIYAPVMIKAAGNGNTEVVDLFLDLTLTYDHNTALAAAITNNQINVVQLIIDKVDFDLDSARREAENTGNERMIELLGSQAE